MINLLNMIADIAITFIIHTFHLIRDTQSLHVTSKCCVFLPCNQ